MNQSGFRLNRKAMFGMMVLAAIGAAPGHAATLAANPLAPDGMVDGLCSLREAVIQINTGANSADCLNSSADAYGTNDTITLAAGTYNLTVTGLDETVTGTAPTYTVVNTPDTAIGDIDIMKSVRIVGTAGADVTIIQWGAAVLDADRDRIFHVYTTAVATVAVAIEGVTIQGGRTFEQQLDTGAPSGDPADPALYDYYFRRAGGGLAVGAGANVAKINPLLVGQEHSAGRGGSRRPTEAEPAGPTFSLTLTGVKVLANQAEGDGAGIYTGSPMTATNIVVSGNSSTINGGGIYNEGVTSIINSTISNNIAEGGGGVFLTGSNTVTVTGTTLSGNRAVGGGAVSGRSGVIINMVNSTLSGNLGADVGAGFYHNGVASLRFVTIANNVAGADSEAAGAGINTFKSGSSVTTIKNVLLAGNKKGWVPVDYKTDPFPDTTLLTNSNCGTTGTGMPDITSAGYNLSSDDTCNAVLTLATDIKPALGATIDPLIGPLASNGGPTQTHALLTGSPALSKGGTEVDVTTDQRGVARETPPDIGAFELVTAVPPAAGGGGGGGCAIGGEGRLDPTMPAMLAAALAFLGLRRRAGK